jgi:hypothetical protein
MGLCATRGVRAEDREQEKVAEFVRYAITSDLVKLREMITKRKMDPNAKDVSAELHAAKSEILNVFLQRNAALWHERCALGCEIAIIGHDVRSYLQLLSSGCECALCLQRRTLESSNASRS